MTFRVQVFLQATVDLRAENVSVFFFFFEIPCLRAPLLTSQGDKAAAARLLSRVVPSHSGKCRQSLTKVQAHKID